jgi:hypothetical protein
LGRSAVVALLAIAVFRLSEQHARAESCAAGGAAGFYALAGLVGGAVAVPFLVADVVYGAQQRWVPPGWAIPQIVIGGGVNAFVAYQGMSEEARMCGYSPVVTIGAAALSVGLITHGVISLFLYESAPATKVSAGIGQKSRSAYVQWVPDLVITPDRTALVAFSAAF